MHLLVVIVDAFAALLQVSYALFYYYLHMHYLKMQFLAISLLAIALHEFGNVS